MQDNGNAVTQMQPYLIVLLRRAFLSCQFRLAWFELHVLSELADRERRDFGNLVSQVWGPLREDSRWRFVFRD